MSEDWKLAVVVVCLAAPVVALAVVGIISDLRGRNSNAGSRQTRQTPWFCSDDYDGPRYTYHNPLRPFPATLLPEGYTVVVTAGQDRHTITTTTPLPRAFIRQMSLELVKDGEAE